MNIDERLEALTQSVELLAHMFRDNEIRNQQGFAELRELQEKGFAELRELQKKSFAELRELQKKNEILAARMMESITSLAHIAQLHDRRITSLEQR